MEHTTLLTIIIAIVAFNFVLEQVLAVLNRRYKKPILPPELVGVYNQEKYEQSLDYQQVNGRFQTLVTTFSFLLSVVLLSSGFFGWLDTYLSQYIEHPVGLALAYFGLLFIGSDLASIPFQWYGTFVIEDRFGFNKMTLRTFVTDKLKGYLLSAVLGGIIASIFLYLVIGIGENFWIYFWPIVSLVMVLLSIFYTSVFVPLFNTLSPLEAGELRAAIEAYSQSVDFPIKNILVIDGSKRSDKSNAFFSGIGKQKKVVLYDTLIANHSTDELVAVIAHEVGHYKKKHIYSSIAFSVLQIGFTLFTLSLLIFNEQISLALGANSLAVHVNLVAFGILFSPISTLSGLLMNSWSRKNEHEADAYAVNTYGATPLMMALKKLSSHNMSNLYPHPWYVFFNYSHPPLLQRLKAVKQISTLKASS